MVTTSLLDMSPAKRFKICGLYVEVIEDSIDAMWGVFAEELLRAAQSLPEPLLRELSLFVLQPWDGD